MGSLKLIGEQEGGSDDHAALANLDFPSAGHTGFVASDGIAGGQTVKGGTGASENLTLQSTDDPTRGVIEIIDSLRLKANSIQDSGGNARITLGTASPHVSLTGDVALSALLGLPNVNSMSVLNIETARENYPWGVGIRNFITNQDNTPIGIYGGAGYSGSSPGTSAMGLMFEARHISVASMMSIIGMQIIGAFYSSGGASNLYGAIVQAAYSGTGRPSVATGLRITNFGSSGVDTARGLWIANQTGATTPINLEVGPPYLRVEGGDAPTGVNSRVIVDFGGTLYRLTRNASTGAVQTVSI